MVTHVNQNLFDAPQDALIMHACNSQGMWGSGIAATFALRYPNSYRDYQAFCAQWNKERGTACGMAAFSHAHESEKHWVGWIVTSHNYGKLRDTPELIKINTALALQDFCKGVYRAHPKDEFDSIDVYSNKFNSGLFSVPWEQTELILLTVLRDYKRINWIVCSEV